MTRTCLFALVLAACQAPTKHRDTTGATAAIDVPVGPVPGPGEASQANPNPYTKNDDVAVEEGFKLFQRYNCAGCHGDHGGGGMGPSLRDVDWRYGDTDAQIYDSIAEGRGFGMPAWGTKLPEDHVWKLVAYIRSLRTAMEPDRPSIAADTEAPPNTTAGLARPQVQNPPPPEQGK
ncbi:MAG: c-type cytochrome [Deltaproteobacteria bacterium]|nr:c-type cytochrome [Deltaproteobacteria bacterium]